MTYKTLLTSFCLLFAFPTLAQEITSPFFLPELGHVFLTTDGIFQKNKWKNNPTTKQYLRHINQSINVGLGAGFVAHLAGQMNWNKQTPSLHSPHTKTYAAGLIWQAPTESALIRLETIYHQTTDVNFSPRRSLDTHIYLGKQFKKMTPYLHLNGQIPLNARPYFNNSIYRIETGVFQNITTKTTFDSALFSGYNKNIHEPTAGIRAELSYLFTPSIAWSINGEWSAYGRAKNNTHTYHKLIGTTLRFHF